MESHNTGYMVKERRCFEYLWLKYKAAWSAITNLLIIQSDFILHMESFPFCCWQQSKIPNYASEIQLCIRSIHCWALCASWAQKLYTRLLVFSCKMKSKDKKIVSLKCIQFPYFLKHNFRAYCGQLILCAAHINLVFVDHMSPSDKL